MLKMPSQYPSTPMHAPGRDTPDEDRRWPSLDDHLVEGETRQEMIRGQLIYAEPAREPHGDTHYGLDGRTQFHLRPGYVGSTDLLTRVSEDSEIAPDVSIRKEGIDPATGTRYLEEVAFEIVYSQRKANVGERAALLSARGVRRVFAIFVTRQEIAEWSPAEGKWRALPPDGVIDDPCFVRPLPVRSLWDPKEGEDAVARALAEKGNPVIEALRRAAREEAQRAAAEAQRKAAEAQRKAAEAQRKAAEAQRNAAEAERKAEAARKQAEEERAAKEAALHELAELKARLGRGG